MPATTRVPSTLLAAAMSLAGCATIANSGDHPDWRARQAPFRIHGNTWYVGTQGLSAILVTSPAGHVLIDGTLEENASLVEASIREAGFKLTDVRVILNTHTHDDHAGAIARLARDSGAVVRASPASANALHHGGQDPADPQFGELRPYPAVEAIGDVGDGDTVHIGDLVLTAHATPGHTTGGTSWTWRSCESAQCVSIAFVDSLTPISAKGFHFGDEAAHPHLVETFRATLDRVAGLPCDLLITPHPGASDFFDRYTAHTHGAQPDTLFDSGACKAYAAGARLKLDARLQDERDGKV